MVAISVSGTLSLHVSPPSILVTSAIYPDPVLKYVFNDPSGISTICASAVAPPVLWSAST